MITIIHGEDSAASRKSFLEEKQKHPDAPFFDGEKMTLTDLTQVFEGGELFSDNKAVFIENFLSKKKKSAEKETLVSYLQIRSKDNQIFLWEGKELERSVLNAQKTAVIKVFKLPQTLFLFVESLAPGNGAKLVSLFQKTQETADTEMIFFMLVRQVRLLLALSASVIPAKAGIQDVMDPRVKPEDDKGGLIDELKRLQPWQMTKLKDQAKKFTRQELLSLYKKLYKLEIGQKTGGLASPLATSIDFLLLEI